MEKNKYLIVGLNDKKFAVSVENIKEIIGIQQITKVPKTDKFIKGAINLRGKIITVVDLSIRIDNKEIDYDTRTSIIIIEISENEKVKQFGIIVDKVLEVVDIDLSDTERESDYKGEGKMSCIFGLFKKNEDVIILLEMKKIFKVNKLAEVG